MAEVEVTVIPLLIQGPLWIEPIRCPHCNSVLIVDGIQLVDRGAPPHMPADARYYRVKVIKP
jgi:hypothetical protein